MIKQLQPLSTIINDSESGDEIPEQPIIIQKWENSDGISVEDCNDNSIYIPYRMIDEVCKAMKNYKPVIKKKK